MDARASRASAMHAGVSNCRVERRAGGDDKPRYTGEMRLTDLGPSDVEIIDYEPAHQLEFAAMNRAWISKHFALEAPDEAILNDPQANVLDGGGAIFLARCGRQLVGTVTLLEIGGDAFELGKMTVIESMRGRGIGERLARHAIDYARNAGKKKIVLESNRKLAAALALYRKLGFRDGDLGHASPYSRCDVTLELRLDRVGDE